MIMFYSRYGNRTRKCNVYKHFIIINKSIIQSFVNYNFLRTKSSIFINSTENFAEIEWRSKNMTYPRIRSRSLRQVSAWRHSPSKTGVNDRAAITETLCAFGIRIGVSVCVCVVLYMYACFLCLYVCVYVFWVF